MQVLGESRVDRDDGLRSLILNIQYWAEERQGHRAQRMGNDGLESCGLIRSTGWDWEEWSGIIQYAIHPVSDGYRYDASRGRLDRQV